MKMETNEQNQEQQATSNEPEQSDEISQTVKEFVTRTANAANSSHASRIQKNIDKKLQENNEKLLSLIKEMMPPRSEQSADTHTQEPAQVPNETLKVKAEVAQLKKSLEEERARVAQKEEEVKRNEERARLMDALRSANVSDERLRGAMALLYTEDKRIGRDASGKIVFKIQKDGYEDEVPLADGIAAWAESAEGKHYVTPKAVAGSGMTGGNAPRRGERVSAHELKRAAVQAVMSKVFGG
jgi:hypothetical protein